MASSGLPLVEQAHISAPVAPQQTAFCDAHDLVAVITTGNEPEHAATVYRLKGEIAFTVALRDDDELRPASIQWKPDGSLLAITWSDQVCCLYSGESGKLLYELPSPRAVSGTDASWTLDVNAPESGNDFDDAETATGDATSHAPITWTSYDESQQPAHGMKEEDDDITTDDFFEMMTGGLPNGGKPHPERSDSSISDLVNSLATLDTTSVLPRLGKIETATGMRYSPEGNKFNTQASTDTIFDASTFAPGVFTTLLASDSHGCVTVFVDETIKVGHIQLSSSEQLKSASRSGSSSQVIVTRDSKNDNSHHLNYVDLPFERLGSPLNYVVSLNTRRLQSLMAYITHTIRCVHQEIQTGIKGVPMRLMKLLEEDLRTATGEAAPEPANIVTIELQHLALTSSFNPVVLKWLKDIVKETGHKRWDQAVNAMYDHIQSYIFKNLLPALQRFVAAACALRGQARYHQHTGKFAIRRDVFDNLIERADMLSVVAQRTLQTVTEEHFQFRAFSKWLRVMIDVAVAGPGCKGADETEERESPNYDMDLVLRYINGPLMESWLKIFTESTPPAGVGGLPKEQLFGHPVVAGLSRDGMVAALQKLDGKETRLEARGKADAATPHPSDPVNLPLLTCLLKAHARVAIEEINDWQAQAVPRTPDVLPLDGLTDGKVWDMSIHPPANNDDGREIVHLLASSSDDSAPSLLRIQRRKSSTSARDVQHNDLALPAEAASVLHASFLPSSPAETEPQILVLAKSNEADTHPLLLLRNLHDEWHTLHTWHASTTYLPSPQHFIVGGRPGKRVVVVFSPAGKGTKWEALDLERTDGGNRGVTAEAKEDDVEME